MIEQLRRWARWLRPGLGLKRWALVLGAGILLISGGGGPPPPGGAPPPPGPPARGPPPAGDAGAWTEERGPGRRDRAVDVAPGPEALLQQHHRGGDGLRRRRQFRPAAPGPGGPAARRH